MPKKKTKKLITADDAGKVAVVRKELEYEALLRSLNEGNIPDTWELLAESLNIHPNTITRWKKRPEFQEALSNGVDRAIKEMEKAGKRDWRMWREKASMLRKEQDKKIGLRVETPEMKVEFIIEE